MISWDELCAEGTTCDTGFDTGAVAAVDSDGYVTHVKRIPVIAAGSEGDVVFIKNRSITVDPDGVVVRSSRWVVESATVAPIDVYYAGPQPEPEPPQKARGASDDRWRPPSPPRNFVRPLRCDRRIVGRFRQRSRLNHRPRDGRER